MKVKVSLLLLIFTFLFSVNINAEDNEALRVAISCESMQKNLQSACSMKIYDKNLAFIANDTTIVIGNEDYQIMNLSIKSDGKELEDEYSFDSETNELTFLKEVDDQNIEVNFDILLETIREDNIYQLGSTYNEKTDEYEQIVNYFYDINNNGVYDANKDVSSSFVGLPINFNNQEIVVELNMTSSAGSVQISSENKEIELDDDNNFEVSLDVINKGDIPVLIADLGVENISFYEDVFTFNVEGNGLYVSYNDDSYYDYLKNNNDLLYPNETINLSIKGSIDNFDVKQDNSLTISFGDATTVLRDNLKVDSESIEINFTQEIKDNEEILDTGYNYNLFFITSLFIVIFITMFVKRGIK